MMRDDRMPGKEALDRTAILMLVVLCASWGLQQVTIKVANQGISPIWQSGIRSIGSTILLLIWMAVRRQPLLERDGTFWYGIAAGLLFSVEFVITSYSIHYTKLYEVMHESVGKFRGRVVDSPGGSLLAEFASVVDAVQCAMEIQENLHARDGALSEADRNSCPA